MTTITFDALPRFTNGASKLQSFFATIVRALDTYAAYRMQNAVPESEFCRADREIKRYRQLIDRRAARLVRQTSAASEKPLAQAKPTR